MQVADAAAATGTDDGFPPPPHARALLWTIALFIAAALVWAALARVDAVVRAPGRVVSERGLQRIASESGGTIAAIVVQPGDRVSAGQPLLRLDPVEAEAARDRETAQRSAARAREVRLLAEASGRTPDFAGLAAADGDPALAAAIATERALFTARARELAAGRTAARARVAEAERASASCDAEAAARAVAAEQAANEVATLGPLVDKAIEPAAALQRARAALAGAQADVRASGAATGRARAALLAAHADKDGVDSRFRAAAADALATTRAELAAAARAAPAFARRADRAVLRAPVAGTVQRVLAQTVGGVARPGEPLVEIAPADVPLLIEARVAVRDIADVHPGQRAHVRLSAYDYAIYGALPARVLRVAPDSEVDEATHAAFYTVRVRVDAAPHRAGDPAPAPGMTAEIELAGETRTVLAYLLTPLTRLRATALTEQ